MKLRVPALLGATAVCWSLAAVLSYWAFGNYQSWYYNTYILEDHSIAELDAILLWIQIPAALVLWCTGGLIVWIAFRRSRTPASG